jgi:membrane-associated phospholipid phosphatase
MRPLKQGPVRGGSPTAGDRSSCYLAGAAASYTLIKVAVGRPRPPPAIWIGHFAGAAFPSGHATQSVACYATLAVILGARRSARAKAALWTAAVLIALIVGASRIYLGAHWLTDVLGGCALGTLLVAVIVIVALTLGRSRAAMVGSDLGGREL